VDALLLRLATSHGAYKFTRKPTGEILAISRIENSQPSAQHSPSDAWFLFVPEDLLAIINKYGGTIPETYGVPVEENQRN